MEKHAAGICNIGESIKFRSVIYNHSADISTPVRKLLKSLTPVRPYKDLLPSFNARTVYGRFLKPNFWKRPYTPVPVRAFGRVLLSDGIQYTFL